MEETQKEAVADKGPALRRLPQEPWERGIGPGIVDKKIMGSRDSNFMLMGIAKMDPGVHSLPHRHRYAQISYVPGGPHPRQDPHRTRPRERRGKGFRSISRSWT